MKIILSPIAAVTNDTPPTATGQVLNYRGQSYNLNVLPDGATVEADAPFIGSISRVNGVAQVTLEYRYNSAECHSEQSQDWADYTFNVTSGACPCPILRKAGV